MLGADGFQENHEQPALLFGKGVSGDGIEGGHRRLHRPLTAFLLLVVSHGAVLHVLEAGLKKRRCVDSLTAHGLIAFRSSETHRV